MSSSRASLTHTSTSRRTCRSPDSARARFPPPIIDQRVGRAAVLEHAVSEGLDTFYRQAVEANELRVLGRPSADVVEWPNEKDFSGDLLVESRSTCVPSSSCPPSRAPTVEVDAVEVDEAAIDEELDRLRARFGTLVTVDRPAATGDFVELDLVATIDGAEIDRAEGVSLRGRLGRAARGHRRGDRLAHRG